MSTNSATDHDDQPDTPHEDTQLTRENGADPTDRAYHLARICAGFNRKISERRARRLAHLLRGNRTDTTD